MYLNQILSHYGHTPALYHYLIDKDGKFIGKYYRTEEVENKLETIFGEKTDTQFE
jgi:hypothetical protein